MIDSDGQESVEKDEGTTLPCGNAAPSNLRPAMFFIRPGGCTPNQGGVTAEAVVTTPEAVPEKSMSALPAYGSEPPWAFPAAAP